MPHIRLAKGRAGVYDSSVSVTFRTYVGGITRCNGYLLAAPDGSYIAIDAPAGFAAWVRQVLPEGGKLSHLLLTHQHFDHVEDAAALREQTGCTVHACLPPSDELCLTAVAHKWGLHFCCDYKVDDIFGPTRRTADWGGFSWRLSHIPGHSPDGTAYGIEAEKLLFTGDILFEGCIGRTDFHGPDGMLTLVHGIKSKLFLLPDETEVYSGHGAPTSIGREKRENTYLL